MDLDELEALCADIRRFLIAEVSVNPGHFASSMGAVELTVALHYVFDTPDDRIVWDVGHPLLWVCKPVSALLGDQLSPGRTCVQRAL